MAFRPACGARARVRSHLAAWLSVCPCVPVHAPACVAPVQLDATTGNITLGCEDGSCQYGDDLVCSWIVTNTAANASIQVSFSWIDIRTSDGCVDDSLQVREVGDGTTLLVQACGTTPPQDVELAAGASMLVTFVSDYFFGASGFGLQYVIVEKAAAHDGDGGDGTQTDAGWFAKGMM